MLPPYVPAPPPAEVITTVRQVDAPFSKFLRYRRFELPDGRRIGVLSGPGHDCASVAATVLDPQGTPHMVIKTGDARLCRSLRGESYLRWGCVAGRMDKAGASPAKIALAELTEEVGGQEVPGTFRPLGDWLSPTMACESTEADACFFSLIRFSPDQVVPAGDGGGMEVAGLIGPIFLDFASGLRAMEEGRVADSGRAQVLYTRCAHSMGYIPELGLWVQDHPRLARRYSSLGLGPPQDPRSPQHCSQIPANFEPSGPQSEIDGALLLESKEIALGQGCTMLDAQTCHSIGPEPYGEPFPNQLLKLPYDRLKVVRYALDPQRGPLVSMPWCERPVFLIKGLALRSESARDRQENTHNWRRDVEDRTLERGQDAPGEALGQPFGASSGQSDLYYHLRCLQESPQPDWIPLSQALQLCREGHGDANTEAALLRLARRLHWLPTLEMSEEQALPLL